MEEIKKLINILENKILLEIKFYKEELTKSIELYNITNKSLHINNNRITK